MFSNRDANFLTNTKDQEDVCTISYRISGWLFAS